MNQIGNEVTWEGQVYVVVDPSLLELIHNPTNVCCLCALDNHCPKDFPGLKHCTGGFFVKKLEVCDEAQIRV